MFRTARTTFAAFALPLVLIIAQGGSCGSRTADNVNQTNAARASDAGAASNAANLNAPPATPQHRSNAGTPDPVITNDNAGLPVERDGDNRGGGAEMNDGQKKRLTESVWGGTGVSLSVKDGSADIEFDCAHGTLGAISTDDGGNFTVSGTFTQERGGPIRLGHEPKPSPVTYSGRISGDTMTLRFTVGDGERLDYTLRRGREGVLRKCR